MLDYLHLPKQQNGNVDYFPGFSNTDGGSWVAWEKPKGIQMIRITCIAGGGGGGSGFSSNTTGSRGGGGSGGSSAISIVTIPAYVLPDLLYISSGIGGSGAAANPADGTANLGSDGIRSYVCVAPDTGVIYRVCYADSGKAGTVAATSTAGGGAVAATQNATIADMFLACYGTRNFISGQGGSSGSTGAGLSVTYPTTGILLSGGVGGNGGVSLTPGSLNAPLFQTVYTIFSNLTAVSGSGNNGQPGREIYQPLLSTGGSGGTANSGTGAGGQGGAGGFGSGGGGGGAGGAGAAGGGGKGGDGLVIIHSW
jgi:hypothetical protein